MSDLSRKDINNPSSRAFCGAIQEAANIYHWRYNLPDFYEAVTGHVPYPYQADFLNDMVHLDKQYAIISAGRGTGKTECLAVLALWYVYVLPLTEPGVPMKVVILAGSEKQARICYGYIMGFIAHIPFLQKALAKDPTAEEIVFIDGSEIKPLTASEKSVRGPHPDLLVIDEACQASDDLLTAAFPMIGTSPYPRLILSSTPDNYFSIFVNIFTKRSDYPQFKPYNWSAEKCPIVSQAFLQSQQTLMDSGNYQVEYLGLPYSFVGKVFDLDKLKECVKWRNLIAGENIKYAGVDWGHYPNPTVVTIVEKVVKDEKGAFNWIVLHSEPFLKQNFEEVLDKIQLIVQSYQVSSIYSDSNDIGENQRLAGRGLPVYPVKFKSEKATMISNLRALVENELIKIDGAKDFSLVAQMRDYRYDTKKNDDFVDSLMLAVKPASSRITPSKWELKDFIIINRKRGTQMSSPRDIKFQTDPRHIRDREIQDIKDKDLAKKLVKEENQS